MRQDPPVIAPDRILELPDVARIGDLAVSADGTTAYVLGAVPAMNIAAVLFYFWPELLALSAWAAALRGLLRRLRRPVAVGEPQCRACGYLLRGLTADRCPECGLTLTPANRIVGRRWTRSLIALALAAVVLPPAWLVGRWRAPRELPTVLRPAWRSTTLAWLARGFPGWQYPWSLRDDAEGLLEIDLSEGRVVREVRPLPLRWEQTLTLAPDGRSVAVNFGAVVERYELTDGSRTHTLRIVQDARELAGFPPRPGFSADGRTLLARVHLAADQPAATVTAWDWATGERVDPQRVPVAERPGCARAVDDTFNHRVAWDPPGVPDPRSYRRADALRANCVVAVVRESDPRRTVAVLRAEACGQAGCVWTDGRTVAVAAGFEPSRRLVFFDLGAERAAATP